MNVVGSARSLTGNIGAAAAAAPLPSRCCCCCCCCAAAAFAFSCFRRDLLARRICRRAVSLRPSLCALVPSDCALARPALPHLCTVQTLHAKSVART